MSEAITVEMLTQLLSRVPGASWSCRIDLLKGKYAWIYIDAKSAERLGLASGLCLMKQCSDIIAIEKSLLQAKWDEITQLVPLDRLGAWVPNETSDLEYWLAKPIRQITTDRPDLALQTRR